MCCYWNPSLTKTQHFDLKLFLHFLGSGKINGAFAFKFWCQTETEVGAFSPPSLQKTTRWKTTTAVWLKVKFCWRFVKRKTTYISFILLYFNSKSTSFFFFFWLEENDIGIVICCSISSTSPKKTTHAYVLTSWTTGVRSNISFKWYKNLERKKKAQNNKIRGKKKDQNFLTKLI